MTAREQETHLRLQARPITWTGDLEKAGTLDQYGRVYVYAGGPVELPGVKKTHTRKDGKVDGRSAGVRKCGRCGKSGHNARTCRSKEVVKAAERPAPARKGTSGRKCGKCGKSGHNARTCGKKR